MDLLFVHPSFPGQFRRIATRLASAGSDGAGHTVRALGDASWMHEEVVSSWGVLSYPPLEPTTSVVHPFARPFEQAVRRGERVVERLLPLKREGFEPEVIFVHPGWGDGLYLKDLFPHSTVVGLFEYYYQPRGADAGFDPEFPLGVADLFRIRTLNAVQQLALEGCDLCISPTAWQRSRYPTVYQERIAVIHEGIDCDRVAPDWQAQVTLPDGTQLAAGDEVITYVARSLEPYRGFHQLMRALPTILSMRPHAQVVIVGEEGVSYGRPPPAGYTWRRIYLDEVAGRIDARRIHFTGLLPYNDYVKVLQISRVHIYLTYPFVLSWSMLEAMAAGCVVVGSRTAPVEEVIDHGVNGLLVPFFEPNAIAAQVVEVLAQPQQYRHLGEAARILARERFDFERVTLPCYRQLLKQVTS